MQFCKDLDYENFRNLLVVIEFDGSNYHGWQVQENALTVQGVLNDVLKKILSQDVEIKGCSRTDAGVHAENYCFSAKIKSKISCHSLILALNRNLPPDISAKKCVEVDKNFHARYSCIAKEYVYKIWNHRYRSAFLSKKALHYWYDLDIDLLNEVAENFIGKYDFSAFCTKNNCQQKDKVREIKKIEIKKFGNMVEIFMTADGFLYNMARIITGTFLKVAQKKIKPSQIKEIIYSKDRKNAGDTVPAYGLYLHRVFYKNVL